LLVSALSTNHQCGRPSGAGAARIWPRVGALCAHDKMIAVGAGRMTEASLTNSTGGESMMTISKCLLASRVCEAV
jgi:hypothetical protein